MVGNDIDRERSAFEVVSPSSKCFEDREEFLVVNIVVKLRSRESARVEGHRVDLLVDDDGENAAKGVVRGISFDDDLCTRIPLNQSWGGGEGLL